MSNEPKKIIESIFSNEWEEIFIRRQFERFRNSWCEQAPSDRKNRMRYVLRMAAELEEIRKTTRFSSGFCEHAIEAVITGDMDDLRLWGIDMISEKELARNTNQADGVRYAVTFAKFRDICEEAVLILDTSVVREKV